MKKVSSRLTPKMILSGTALICRRIHATNSQRAKSTTCSFSRTLMETGALQASIKRIHPPFSLTSATTPTPASAAAKMTHSPLAKMPTETATCSHLSILRLTSPLTLAGRTPLTALTNKVCEFFAQEVMYALQTTPACFRLPSTSGATATPQGTQSRSSQESLQLARMLTPARSMSRSSTTQAAQY